MSSGVQILLLTGRSSEWGAELFIPYAFSTVETILPRMLSQAAEHHRQARDQASEENVENIKATIEAQQEQIDYELILQKIARNGLMGGLGVQKVYWRRDERPKKVVAPADSLPGTRPCPSSWSRRRRAPSSMTRWWSASTRSTGSGTRSVTVETCEWLFPPHVAVHGLLPEDARRGHLDGR
jgi:hypothetical protein